MNEVFIPPDLDRREPAIERVLQFIRDCRPGRRLKVTIAEARAERSDAQNNALWGVAYPPLMDFMGLRGQQDRDELHEYFCGEYFGWVEYEMLTSTRRRPRRTTTKNEQGKREVMNTVDFMAFFSFVQQRAAEQGVFIPDPDPEWFRKEVPDV